MFLGVGERTVDGVGALFFADGEAYLLGWDLSRGEWFPTGPHVAPESVTSIGLRYSANEIVLRINKADTPLKVTGQFQLAPMILEKLWLMALGDDDTTAWFDNVCAGPVSAPQRILSVTKTGSGRGTVGLGRAVQRQPGCGDLLPGRDH